MARYEVLSEDAMATIERGWRRLLQDIGIAFNHPEALRLFREAGQIVEDEVVRLDPDFVLDLVAKAPSTFTLRARNPERSFPVGGDVMNFVPVQGPPFVREGDVRRDGTFDDFCRFLKLAQVYDDFDTAGRPAVRAQRPADGLAPPRHAARADDAHRQALQRRAGLARLRRTTRSRWPA